MDFQIATTDKHHVYNLLIGLVAPRPVALVTSLNEDGGVNAAPYSAYNYFSTDPPVVGLGIAERSGGGGAAWDTKAKDTGRNIRQRGEFVVNVVTDDLMEAMTVTAIDFPAGVSEIEEAGLHTVASSVVQVPRIAEAHAALECVELQTIEIGRSRIVLGRVVSMWVEDRYVDPAGPYIRAEELHAMGRMNGQGAYVRTRDAFVWRDRIKYADWKGRGKA